MEYEHQGDLAVAGSIPRHAAIHGKLFTHDVRVPYARASKMSYE